MHRVDIFGINYAATDYDGATAEIIEKAKTNQSFSVFALPVHGVIERQRDPEFKEAIDKADLVLPDGQPIKWAMNYFHDTNLDDRVYGPELTRRVLKQANALKLRVFLYGGSTPLVLKRFEQFIAENYPSVRIVGAYRERIFGKTTLSNDIVTELKPHIILVGLGCPNQEKWIAKNQDQINGVMMGVGAAFSFFSGETKMAPEWMQRRGLEWVFRLVREPRRLWRRYFYTNVYFSWLVLKKILTIDKY
jgi:exopolysaccharide biosynthesis WecB/TagA/CpsF family protein